MFNIFVWFADGGQFSNVESARLDLNKSKEQLEEEKKISLSFRIHALEIDGLGVTALRTKAQALWENIVQLETEKYDLEERSKRQDYDVSILILAPNPSIDQFSVLKK